MTPAQRHALQHPIGGEADTRADPILGSAVGSDGDGYGLSLSVEEFVDGWHWHVSLALVPAGGAEAVPIGDWSAKQRAVAAGIADHLFTGVGAGDVEEQDGRVAWHARRALSALERATVSMFEAAT